VVVRRCGRLTKINGTKAAHRTCKHFDFMPVHTTITEQKGNEGDNNNIKVDDTQISSAML